MKEITLTRGYVAIVDDDDFVALSRYKWQASVEKRRDGTVENVYATRFAKRRTIRMHREVLGISDPSIHCDHINHNGLDNRRENLRTCSLAENNLNRRKNRGNTSGLKGVSWTNRRGKWAAQISISGRAIWLGYYSDKETAAQAYKRAAEKLHGQFACSS